LGFEQGLLVVFVNLFEFGQFRGEIGHFFTQAKTRED